MALPALVELRAEQLPSLPNRFPIDHESAIHQQAQDVNPSSLSHRAAARHRVDSLIVANGLRRRAVGRWGIGCLRYNVFVGPWQGSDGGQKPTAISWPPA